MELEIEILQRNDTNYKYNAIISDYILIFYIAQYLNQCCAVLQIYFVLI